MLIRAALLALLLVAAGMSAGAEEPRTGAGSRPFPRGSATSNRNPGLAASADAGSGWWTGTVVIAVALAACGWGSVVARRYLPKNALGAGGNPLRVVGRTSLSPKHSIYLVEAGGKTLIVGTGPQGPPSLLGELPGPPETVEPPTLGAQADPFTPSRFDRLVGDDA